MASDQKNVDFICEQMNQAGDIRSRKMFGEYAIYCDDKVIALVCDDQLFLKVTEPGRAIAKNVKMAPAYPGAKDSFLIPEDEWEDAAYLSSLARVTANALPLPKKK
jgi:DNA transformation protein